MNVTQKELASCLGITIRQVYRLEHDGIIKKDTEAKGYRLEHCVQAYIEYKINSETGRSTAISKEKVQAEHEEIKKQISIVKLRKLRRELHEASDVEACWTDALINLRNKMDALPSKIVMAIAGENMNRQIEIVDGIIKDLEKELSEYDPDDIDHGITMDDALLEDETEPEEGEGE